MSPLPPDPSRPAHEPFIADFSEGLETGLYLALLELIDEGLIITGDEVMIDANSAACRLLERDYRQIVGKPLADLFPSERAFLSARERLLIQGEMRGSIQVVLPGGRRRNLRFVAAARLRPGMHALILSPDIVAEAYASPPVASEDRMWPRLAAAINQPVLVLDEQHRIQALNTAASSIAAIADREVRGLRIEDVTPVHWPAEGSTPIARVGDMEARVLPGPRTGWRVLLLQNADPPASLPQKVLQQAAPARPAGSGIRLALEHGQFSLSLFPVVDARGARVVGASAELVWDHPGHGLIGPSEYRDEALAAGIGAELDEHLLLCAFEAAALWPADSGDRCTVSIRPTGCNDETCARMIEAALDTCGVAASRIDIALDAEALHQAQVTLETVRRIGAGIALDEAGTDGLPLAELARGGFRALRLPKQLVASLGHDESGEAIIEMLVNVAATLRLDVIACGVTSAAHRDFLIAIGCPLQQGPLYGPPLSAGGFATRLRQQLRTG